MPLVGSVILAPVKRKIQKVNQLIPILRQILEPKIVSDTVKVHPLAVMGAIYFSIVAMNIWILFYVVLLFLVYKVLTQAGVLPSINEKTESK